MADEATVKKILEEFQKGTKTSSKLAVDSGKLIENAFGLAGAAAGGLRTGFEFLKNEVEGSLNTFRDLSKTGASFSNDVVGMTVAAKGMRLEMKDFQELMGKNAINFAGLGGNVTRGAEEFAKLSKGLMESKFVDELRQAGFSNKELNEVLALQVSFTKTSIRDDKKSRDEAIKSAADLAREMDLMAKMTGKSREAQMEEAKKLQTDQQVQAKLRQLTQGKSDEEAARIRSNFIKQYTEAESRGFGQAFKEVFATGVVQTKESATQASVFQEQFAATRKQALATQLGDEKAASAAAKEARAAGAKDFNDFSKNQLLTLGSATGPLFDTMSKTYNAQQTFNEGLEATAKKFGMSLKTEEDRLAVEKKMREEAVAAAAGRDKEGKEVSGATKAMINLGSRAGDVEAALYKKLLIPLNEKIGPGLGDFAQTILGARTKSGKAFTTAVEDTIQRGYDEEGKPRTGGRRGMLERERGEEFGLVGSIIKDTAGIVKKSTDALDDGIRYINQQYTNEDGVARRRRQQDRANVAPEENTGGRRGMLERDRQQRDLGTLGMTGQLWETPGLKEIGPNVKETILTEGQLTNMIKGINNVSVANTVNTAMTGQKNIPSIDQNKNQLEASGLSSMFKEMISMTKSQADSVQPSIGHKQMDSMLSLSSLGPADSKVKISASDNLKTMMPASNELKSTMMSMVNSQRELMDKVKGQSAEETQKILQAEMQKLASANQEGKNKDIPKLKTDTATLNDVVSSLNQLNKQIGQLIDVQVDIGSKQIRATKSNSKNLFERA